MTDLAKKRKYARSLLERIEDDLLGMTSVHKVALNLNDACIIVTLVENGEWKRSKVSILM